MASATPVLHNLTIGDIVTATITGPWWTGRQLEIVGFRLDGDIAIVRDAAPFPGGEGTVSVPSDLLVRAA